MQASFPSEKNICEISEICVTLKLIKRNYNIIMKFFRIPNAEKLGNFILTVITAFVSTFLMQSCGILH